MSKLTVVVQWRAFVKTETNSDTIKRENGVSKIGRMIFKIVLSYMGLIKKKKDI